MNPHEDPEDRIRELERPLADSARTSEVGGSQPADQAYAPGPGVPPPPNQWSYGGPFSGPPPRPPSSNRVWWILGAVIVIGVLALAGGIAAFAAHQLSGVRSIITSPPTISVPFTSPANSPTTSPPSKSRTRTSAPSTSATAPAGGQLTISGINENRTVACNDSVVSVSGVSNTVVITGHCASLTVSGVQNAITVDAVDTIDASGFDNKITYHTGTPKITNAGGSNSVEQG